VFGPNIDVAIVAANLQDLRVGYLLEEAYINFLPVKECREHIESGLQGNAIYVDGGNFCYTHPKCG
jgi:hypothetical protein